MTSSTLTGDRRWASARRGGMTVLGKVAVPKPINLPSQRLENHGLDPNVEIVPKGTLSWGSRPSSAGSNAWGSSTLSPSTDGGSSSPSYLVGRPSSGGGTRPSTAGSEKAHDSNVSVWGSNSRPSSASGVLASNHTSSTSLRPRSAETRPGSSHLSRFAEPAPEGSGVWSATSASERTGVASSAKEGFSLSAGDFPTLGSEKDESKNMDPLDHPSHGHPISSGDVRTMSDDVSRNSDIRGDTWRKDGPPFVEDGPRPSLERWHGEPHLYPNPNMAPHYDSWRGAPPVNPPGGVWFRGPPGPPYGGPLPHGGFPMEPFPYYHPQVPAPGLPSSQKLPPAAGHIGLHPKNGDMPPMPHVPHMHPGMPMRPGFYPGPIPYDSFYRPPLGFCNPSDRDLPFMGMPSGPPAYGIHANQNAPEHVEPGHPHDPRGPYKVLMNPNDGWNEKEEEKWGHRMTTSAANREKGILSKPPLQENAWGDDYKKDEDIHYGKNITIEASSHSSDDKFASVNPSSLKFPERLSNIDEAQMSPAMDNVPYPRDHSLIQKIESLNAKARAAGGKQEGFRMEEPNHRVQITNAKDHQFSNGANSDIILERHYPTGVLVPVPHNSDVPLIDKDQESANASVTAAPRRFIRGTQSRGDPHAKGKFHGQEADGWGKKIDSQPVLESGSRSTTNDQVEDHYDTIMSNVDPSDMQRAKMREIAKQRAIQLQKEEEERVREQKAKALAKLEELNRRSANPGVESSSQKETIPHPADAPKKREFSTNQSEPSMEDSYSAGPTPTPINNTSQIDERNTSRIGGSGVSSRNSSAETQRDSHQEDAISSQNQLPTDANIDEVNIHKNVSQVREMSRQKRGGYKQRQYVPPEKNIIQDAIPSGRADVVKDVKVTSSTQEVGGNFVDPGVGKEEVESSISAELPVQKKKVNKSGKNRHKVEDSSTAVSSLPKDLATQSTPEAAGQNGSNLHVNSVPDPKDATQSLEIYTSKHYDDTHGRVNNAGKAQHSRKPRNTHGNRSSDKSHSNDAVFWAPVRSHDKHEITDQMSQKSSEPLISSATGDNFVSNNSKTKRAEMERYVPKPVAKELAQQGSNQQPSCPSIDPPAADGSGGREKASQGSENVMKAGANVDGKKKHQRAQGSWRQRGSAESIPVHSSQDNSVANTSQNTQTSNWSQLNARSDGSLVRGPPSIPDEPEKGPQIEIDGWGFVVNDSSFDTSATFAVVKDYTPSGRGKRHPPKGQKGSGSHHQNLDHIDVNAGWTDLQSSHVEPFQFDKMSTSKESQADGDRSASHWQPKSQGYVAHNQGNRSQRSQNLVTEESKALKRESGPNSGAQYFSKDPILVSEDKGAGQGKPSLGHHEAKRDRRVGPVKGRPHSPSQEPETLADEVEPASFGAMDGRSEQRPTSGYRKNTNYNKRFNRGHEPLGEWSSTVQQNRQHYSSANRERQRQRQNAHYEYQPVGPNNDDGRSNEPVVQAENQSGASRFRERGQGHSRRGRGNSYGRQSGNE